MMGGIFLQCCTSNGARKRESEREAEREERQQWVSAVVAHKEASTVWIGETRSNHRTVPHARSAPSAESVVSKAVSTGQIQIQSKGCTGRASELGIDLPWQTKTLTCLSLTVVAMRTQRQFYHSLHCLCHVRPPQKQRNG